MLKRLISLTAVLLMLMAIIAGCTSNEVVSEDAAETKAPAEEGSKVEEKEELEEITLTYAMPQSQYKDVMKTLVERYQEEHPNVTIDVQAIPDGQYDDLMLTKINLGEAPDLFVANKSDRMKWGIENFVEFVDEPWQERLIDGMDEYQRSGSDEGKLHTVLMQGPALDGGILYNTKIFEKYGIEIPTTMDEMYSVCEKLKAEGITPLYASDKDLWTIQILAATTATQYMTSEDYKKINNNELKWADVPELVEAIDVMASFREMGYTNEDFLAATYDSALVAMAEEKAAMYVMGTWFISDVAKANPDVELGCIAIPLFSETAGAVPPSGNISIWKGSENIEAAKDYINWFTQPENFNEYQLAWGVYPVYSDQNLQMPEWQQKIYDDYIASGKIGYYTLNSNVITGTDLNPFWSYQQEVLVGLTDAKGALEKWDIEYANQAKALEIEAFK